MKNYFVTGATGIVGSQVLYELIDKKLTTNEVGEILLLVRATSTQSAQERVEQLFHKSLLPNKLKEIHVDQILKKLIIIESDLEQVQNIQDQIPNSLSQFTVIHLAGSVDLSTSNEVSEKIKGTNYRSTISFLEAVKDYCEKFCFVSTAFSSGHREGKIEDEYDKLEEYQFRNPYEKYKLKTEFEVKEICIKNNIDYQILRPSVVCGRLIEEPLYVISKYLVFYLYGAFFHKLSAKKFYGEHLRVHINKGVGLNIVPVDYVAKGIIAAIQKPIKQLNLVSSQNMPLTMIAEVILNQTGLKNWKFVEDFPKNLNRLEKLYYKTVGEQFKAYIDTANHEFETLQLRKLLPNIQEPDVALHFEKMFEDALTKQFKTVLG